VTVTVGLVSIAPQYLHQVTAMAKTTTPIATKTALI
jgi:hypothetical protein